MSDQRGETATKQLPWLEGMAFSSADSNVGNCRYGKKNARATLSVVVFVKQVVRDKLCKKLLKLKKGFALTRGAGVLNSNLHFAHSDNAARHVSTDSEARPCGQTAA
ncbi:hypothetical protein TRVL_07621 [Trypanosoma vivax]|uniref:Uncharacterized protein n=1 Tax=Trypanosoma vivax (strain Y486) TaxID=1055687 RepID=F9WVL7_TRYVY|nr:hypothetical protein TRVL_07621 [Trypanosoma vivax]CCD21625.1 hypothetical protein TvY486_0045440 [Trypanosoma vivax Y486]|eukprot:CCD21625.1 hypothetical protein TvY486_0045440 [Trypanosoma vivax Y486]